MNRLAEAVSVKDMEIIALGYLYLDYEVLDNLKWEYYNDTMMLKRGILRHWLSENTEDSTNVSVFCIFKWNKERYQLIFSSRNITKMFSQLISFSPFNFKSDLSK